MEAIIEFINLNVNYAPFIICGLLLLAGLNVPVSEDLMLIVSGVLAAKNPDMLVVLFLGVYAGAYGSDIISYWLGRKLGPRLWNIKLFAKMVKPEQVDKIAKYYEKFGPITLLLGRFIPFGVRNGLFLTAGLSGMNFFKFAISDLVACTLSNLALFSLAYFYGEAVIEYVKKGNIVIFSIAAVVVLSIYIYKRVKAKKAKQVEEA